MRRASRRRGGPPRALTIAGSDSSAGAGLQADLLTFAAFGVFGSSAATAITVQSSKGVLATHPIAPRVVAAQVEVVLADLGADAVKTGMLCDRATVTAVARALRAAGVVNLVVDPVIRATSGAELLDHDGVRALRDRLLPLARAVTPNVAEAEALAGMEIGDVDSAIEAARRIRRFGVESVVVTGGHFAGEPVDVRVDARGVRRFTGRRIPGDAHGTGCVFSAALAAGLARGSALDDAIDYARRFVRVRLRRAVALGRGRRLLDLRR